VRLVLAAMLVLLAVPTAALAGTAELRQVALPYGTGADLVYRAAPGERNQVQVSVEQGPVEGGVVRLEDSVGITPGPGCRPPDDMSTTAVTCGFDDFLSSIRIRLGDGDDSAALEGYADYAELEGASGNDSLRGSDFLGSRIRLAGGAGNDRMAAGGYEVVFDEGRHANGSDSVTGLRSTAQQPGSVWVDYGARRRSIHADLAGDRDDGERGERDRIAGGIDSIRGGSGDDRLVGGAGADALVGGRGTDVLAGRAGEDRLVATILSRRRTLPGSLALSGRTGDRLSGGGGIDFLEGSAGPNVLVGGGGADLIWAMGGSDRIRAADGDVDEIDCGNGRDGIREDPIDFRRQCERTRSMLEGAVPLSLELFDPDKTYDPRVPYRALITLRCSGTRGPPCSGSAGLELDGASLGEGRFRVPRDINDYAEEADVMIMVSEEVAQLIQRGDPRVTVVVSRDQGIPRELRVGPAQLRRGMIGPPAAPLRWWR
jgi:RTX calcium-binding nonapeptide repeat (4 copies)